MSETELNAVPGWTPEQVAKLATSWITSAEQVVAVGVTDGGVRSLAEQLDVSDDEMQRLIGQARLALSPEARTTMGQRVSTFERGLGARPTNGDEADF